MKYLLLSILFAFLFSNCRTEENCVHPDEPSAPVGYEMEKIRQIQSEKELRYIQFIDNTTGFMLDGDDGLLKTTDGGITWNNLHTVNDEIPKGLLFVDTETGYIPLYSDVSNVRLIKTVDGGMTWTAMEYSNIQGRIYRIIKGENNTLYAIIRSGSFQTSSLIKSTDGAQTWEKINDFTFSYSEQLLLHGDKIYIASNGKIIICDRLGNHIKTLTTPISSVNTLIVLDENNLVIGSDVLTIKTTDGGNNWLFINSEKEFHRIVHFSDENNGIMLFSETCSASDYGVEVFGLESTTTAGDEWNLGEYFTPSWDIYSMSAVPKGDNSVLMIPLSASVTKTVVLYEINKK